MLFRCSIGSGNLADGGLLRGGGGHHHRERRIIPRTAPGGPVIEVLTAGALPPISINLRFGLWEGFFTFTTNVVALLGAMHLWDRLRGNYAALLLYLILVMGINGLVMTRDLFNLFVFLEIVSIATYGLLGLERTPAAMAAAFKYIMATVIASTFLLLGTVLLYYTTGMLNIDALIDARAQIAGPIGTTALLLVLACFIIELKPFPANGWGLDVYETAPSGVAAMVSVGVSAGVFFALLKLLPLFEGQLGLIALSGGITFLFSNLIGLTQTKIQRLLGYSSIGQMGLLLLALALLQQIGASASIPLVVGGLFVNHLFAKAGLFWFAGLIKRDRCRRDHKPLAPPSFNRTARAAHGGHCRSATFPRLLGEMGTGHAVDERSPPDLDRRHPGRFVARSGLYVPMVRPGTAAVGGRGGRTCTHSGSSHACHRHGGAPCCCGLYRRTAVGRRTSCGCSRHSR